MRYKRKKVDDMNTTRKVGITGLTKEKKEILKKSVGKCTSKIDFNKVKDSWKYEDN
jgi:hypothetical protein